MIEVGTTFNIAGKKYKVEQATACCIGCAFKYKDDNCLQAPPCMSENPNKDLIFVEVKQ